MSTYPMPLHDVFHFSVQSLRDTCNIRYPVKPSLLHLESAIDWLCRAQDVTEDNGVSAYYSVFKGWAPSFIETTGYIIETFLVADKYFPEKQLKKRAERMGQFVIDMQLSNGGYRTYTPNHVLDSSPTIFNTGQDLLGMNSLFKSTKRRMFKDSAEQAADFLCEVQNEDGTWTKFDVDNRPHTYHSRVAYALIELGLLLNNKKYIDAGKKNLEWVLSQQTINGWFNNAFLPGLAEPYPITHTISYTLEGLFYSGRALGNKEYLVSAMTAIEVLATTFLEYKWLSATYSEDWNGRSNYTCLTGNAQLAILWFEAYSLTKDEKYLEAGLTMNNYLKSMQNTSTSNNTFTGGMKGSHPIQGSVLENKGYCRFALINWGTKFFCDSLLEEIQIKR